MESSLAPLLRARCRVRERLGRSPRRDEAWRAGSEAVRQADPSPRLTASAVR
ncbi:hypothetical protein I6G97_05260 [Edwardsiella hoshinae]|uniref:hypothetical protein n=1 Tax=Edwardsiella hoshinae TaxID=93378 RepID=UPI0012DF608A|nr:hypothetical protein [Edwardsiella hoshinae]QPR29003.1 hypothetical protein I6G97_05260 [Edwardsiella hoshinae]